MASHSTTTSRVLYWHRRDLRLADNLGLMAAAEISPAVTGLYVLDPQLLNPPEHLPPCLLYTSDAADD